MQEEKNTPEIEIDFREILLSDYRMACVSREVSILGRKEVLTGKAKFGIFGDGKEVCQLALAKVVRPGDWRSGYYRDQTFMMALNLINVQQYFAALYGDTDLTREPTSGGRQMGGHFATRFLSEDGDWLDQMADVNSSSDLSPTAAQMPRLLGLAQASKVYKSLPEMAKKMAKFTDGGNEIAYGMIGDASTSQGLFWETLNAACVLEVPMLMSVWDDGYGISVPKEYHTTKESISEALRGFQKTEGTNGLTIFRVKGWDYPALVATYEEAEKICRETHSPVLVHVEELTQPQGHSTSGSHERYKSKERMEWAAEYDCIRQMAKFLVLEGTSTEDELAEIRKDAKKEVREKQKEAWNSFRVDIDGDVASAVALLRGVEGGDSKRAAKLEKAMDPGRGEVMSTLREAMLDTAGEDSPERKALQVWLKSANLKSQHRYSSNLYSDGADSALKVPEVPAIFSDELVDGRQVLQKNFEEIFTRYPNALTFGEDVGGIGGVNQVMEGMQDKFGEERVSDTGIRESTIIGSGIGMALRGLRPIAEIQYLDYLYYALQILRDDLATVRYRTAGGQKAPLIVRTRGHRLEGIWHSGSPMGAIISSLRGMHVCVPRNMVQAAGMYNTLLRAEEPALVIECLNGYRKKELMPSNCGEYTVPLGKPEITRTGTDLTILSYGSTFNICTEAAERLSNVGIDVELVDVQTLLPFDIDSLTANSVSRTNRLLIVDEDVPGGASAFLLDQVLNKQGAWKFLDSAPRTLTAKPHLPAYTSDGDYFSKPSLEDIVEEAYSYMSETDPLRYPTL
ncbi:MAG: thiamine pyrophosphate-dependent enzyme [Bacteroidetes bacterium]|nr:thiamine pyrophosphate-dependent enzyme [Bacteroidota bacterium]MDA0980476.1 thiamine pyrophosphate-dependent enzyme [Bacteroidota bacterium]